jgi:uncharacterized protein YneF (UPF0154 family)
MPKRISKNLKDPNQIAAAVVAASTSEEPPIDRELLSRVMAEMGRKGGKIGGKRSMETMSPVERKKRAKKAAIARWKTPSE